MQERSLSSKITSQDSPREGLRPSLRVDVMPLNTNSRRPSLWWPPGICLQHSGDLRPWWENSP
eukprot:2339640-Prorocentrum_lima.AAC.1